MTVTSVFFTEERERWSRYNVVQIEVNFVSTMGDSDKYLAPF